MRQYFKATSTDSSGGFQPAVGFMSISDGSLESIGHLFVASLIHNGSVPNFLAPWVYNYLTKDQVKLPTSGSTECYDKVSLLHLKSQSVNS